MGLTSHGVSGGFSHSIPGIDKNFVMESLAGMGQGQEATEALLEMAAGGVDYNKELVYEAFDQTKFYSSLPHSLQALFMERYVVTPDRGLIGP